MAIPYPIDCDTPAKRTEWLYRAQELLRHLHNLFGYWSKHEITQEQYDNPPLPDIDEQGRQLLQIAFNYLKTKYPYVPQLSQEDWHKFLEEDHDPRKEKVISQILLQRAALKISNTWEVKVEEL